MLGDRVDVLADGATAATGGADLAELDDSALGTVVFGRAGLWKSGT